MPVVGGPEGWEYGVAQQRAAQAADLQNALITAQMRRAQSEEARANALQEQLLRAAAGPDMDMNAIGRALLAGGHPQAGVNLLSQLSQQRQQETQQNALRALFTPQGTGAGGQAPTGPPTIQPTQIQGLAPREQLAIAQDMAMNPARGGAQYVGATPGDGMTQAELSLAPPMQQTGRPGAGGIFGEFLNHPNPDIQRMARTGLAIGQAGGFKDIADANAYLERMTAAAVQAGNVDRSMMGGPLVAAVGPGGPVFLRNTRGGEVAPVQGFTPPPSKTDEGGWREDLARERLAQQRGEAERREDERKERQLQQDTAQFSNRMEQAKVPGTVTSVNAVNQMLGSYSAETIPGTGGVKNIKSPMVDFFLSEDGKKVKSTVQAVANDLLNMYSGLAVTAPEEDRRDLEMMRGGAFNAQDLYNAWPRIVGRMNAIVGNIKAGYGPEVVKTYASRPGAVLLDPINPVGKAGSAPQQGEWKVIR